MHIDLYLVLVVLSSDPRRLDRYGWWRTDDADAVLLFGVTPSAAIASDLMARSS